MAKQPAPPPRYLEKLRLKEARLEAGLDQAEAGERVNTNANNISRWETGERHIRAWQLVMLAEAYGMPPAKLIEDGDGLSVEERELVEFLRKHPQDAGILMATARAMRERRNIDAA